MDDLKLDYLCIRDNWDGEIRLSMLLGLSKVLPSFFSFFMDRLCF